MMFIAGLIIGFFISFYLTKAVVYPLNTLTSVAQRIKEGSYDSDIPECQDLELKTLATALNSMQLGIQTREDEINKLAYYDSMTELPNRNFFLKKIESLINSQIRNILLIIIDLDRFKDVNDTLGHEIGDELLKMIAQRMQAYHLGNCFHAHLNGDEFGILIWDTECFDNKTLIAQYEKLFSIPYSIQGIHLDVDASIGIAYYPEHAETASKLMQCADIALYKCKSSHLTSVVFSESINTHSLEKLQLMSELRKAIDKNQLVLYYQPKIQLQHMSFTSVECLVRWIHPNQGFIGPDQFIPLAEQSGAIRELTQWAIQTALNQQNVWAKKGLNINVAVNISAVDLIDLSLPSYVANLLEKFSCYPRNLTLEVTESTIMAEPESAYQALTMLKTMGIRLSIDDFGTGYSSLGQLKKLPVNELKIDQSFVRNLHNNKEDKIITKSASDLSHNLNLSVVAEGVENKESLDILKSLKVDSVQGYYFSKPLPSEQLWDWYVEFENSKYKKYESG